MLTNLLVGDGLLLERGAGRHERLDLCLRRLELVDQEVAHRLRVLREQRERKA